MNSTMRFPPTSARRGGSRLGPPSGRHYCRWHLSRRGEDENAWSDHLSAAVKERLAGPERNLGQPSGSVSPAGLSVDVRHASPHRDTKSPCRPQGRDRRDVSAPPSTSAIPDEEPDRMIELRVDAVSAQAWARRSTRSACSAESWL